MQRMQEAMAAMQAQLKVTQAENERLRRQTARAAAKPVKKTHATRSPATSTPATSSPGGEGGAGAPGSGGKRVLAPSSRLYNPSKLQEKAEKLAKAKEEAELAACSFRPQTKAAAAEQASPSGEGGAAPPKARGTSASNRLFMQAKRHQAHRSELSNQKGDLEVKACTFSPAIDERSVKIASVSEAAKGSAFSRLSVPRKPQSSETVNGVSPLHTRTHACSGCLC
jgi:hypothetical protein